MVFLKSPCLFGCTGGECREVWSPGGGSGLYLHKRLAWQLEDVRVRADALERAGAAAQALLKTPYLAEGLAVLAATRAAARPVLRCDFARLRKEYVSMSAVMRFTRGEERPFLHIGNGDGARWSADSRRAAHAPLVIRAVWQGRLSQEVMRVLAGNDEILDFRRLGHGFMCVERLGVCEVILKRSRN